MTILPGFTAAQAHVNGQTISYARAGDGPPVLLLHGFPQTHAMWHAVAPALAANHTVIAADLRGYGASTKPPALEDMSFRHMAADQIALLAHLGFERFHVVGHDRGGRTAHRLALDAPERVISLTLMDIIPTHRLLDDLSQEVARAYYHWFFLAQPAPFPETLIAHDPDHYFETCLAGWGPDGLSAFDPSALDAYRKAWRDAQAIRTMCNDYRAAIDVDFALDEADLARRLDMPALILFGADGIMARACDVPASWSDRLTNMQAQAIPGGHFFPDTHPRETTKAIQTFLGTL